MCIRDRSWITAPPAKSPHHGNSIPSGGPAGLAPAPPSQGFHYQLRVDPPGRGRYRPPLAPDGRTGRPAAAASSRRPPRDRASTPGHTGGNKMHQQRLVGGLAALAVLLLAPLLTSTAHAQARTFVRAGARSAKGAAPRRGPVGVSADVTPAAVPAVLGGVLP